MTLSEARKLLFHLRATYREAMAEQLNTTQMSSSTLVGLGVLVAGLAGLYIGGDGQNAYAIPAWQLFDLGRWATFPAGARLEPVSI